MVKSNYSDEELERMSEEHDKFLDKETEKQAEEYAKWQAEWIEEDAEEQIKRFLKSFQEAKEETQKNNKVEIIKLNYNLQNFSDLAYYYIKEPNKDNFYLSGTYNEITESLFDSFALSIVGRYKTAYILMRKVLEIFAVAEYLDSNKTSYNDEKAKKWMFESENPPKTYTFAIEQMDNSGELNKLYSKYLCKFAHNAGTKEYLFLFGYNKQAFEIYAKKMTLLLEHFTKSIEKKPKSPE